MNNRDDRAEAEPLPGPAITPGFVAFIGLLLLPAFLALAVYVGAALVAGDVYAAQQPPAASAGARAGGPGEHEAAAWKRTLVGICPLH